MTKVELTEAVKELHSNPDKPDASVRIAEVDALIEQYFSATGEVPEDKVVGRMADYLLVDTLADQHKRTRNDEYPIQSKNQVFKQRNKHHHNNLYDAVGM